MAAKKLILLIEDEVLMQQSLVESLTTSGFEVYAYDTAEEAITSGLLPLTALIIMDIQLPGMSGLDAAKQIKERFPLMPVIMLTAFGEIDYRIQGFATGADDYVIKPFFTEELLARIKAVLARYELLPNKKVLYQLDDLLIDFRAKTVSRAGNTIKLSQTEFNLLTLLADEEGQPVSKEQIGQTVWKGRYNVNDNTIEVYINLLRSKLDKPFARKLIHTKPGFGYYLSQKN